MTPARERVLGGGGFFRRGLHIERIGRFGRGIDIGDQGLSNWARC